MLDIAAAVLYFISSLINAADIGTNDVFSSTNVMLLGVTALALHLAGIGAGRSTHTTSRRWALVPLLTLSRDRHDRREEKSR
ncbi:hypothetical protein ACFVZR_37905 [Streptomyces sp. NPDC058316]|uniref:hypothetical protein n=1 Tax=unclassified Streptomyces TaxID=2593676 RepID=UPI0036EE64CF